MCSSIQVQITLHKSEIKIEEVKDAAIALKPLTGAFLFQILAFGLFIPSIFSVTILHLATEFYICEAFGFEAYIDKKLKDAPEFFTLLTAIIVIDIAIILIPGVPLIQITLGSQVINSILLSVVLIFMMLIVNNTEIMGNYINSKIKNVLGWATIINLSIVTIILAHHHCFKEVKLFNKIVSTI